MSRTSPLRRLITILTASLLVGGLGVGLQASGAPPAAADTFQPPPEAPTVSNVTITSDQSGTFLGMTPAFPRSSEIYTVSADVESPATLVGLESVQMCLWLENAADCDTYDGTNPYDQSNTPDPQTVFVMEWSWDIPAADLDQNGDRVTNPQNYDQWTDQFAIVDDDGNNYEIFDVNSSGYDAQDPNQTPSGSTALDGDPTSDLTMRVDFSFRISNAMRHSNDWNVRVLAEDTFLRSGDTLGQAGSAGLEDQLVNYFGSVRAKRAPIDYGPVVKAGNSVVEDQPMGTYTANSQSDITIEATDFEDQSKNRTLQLGSSAGSGDLNLECTPGGTFDASSGDTVFVAGSPQTFLEGIPVSLDEAPDAIGDRNNSINSHSCRVSVTSGANVIEPNIEYSNAVTVAIGADELTSPGNLQLLSSPPDSNDKTEVTLTWDQPIAANDTDKTVTQYAVLRDGSEVSVTCGGTTYSDGIVDSNLSSQMECIDPDTIAGTTYNYSVQASIDGVGAGTASSTLTTEADTTVTLLATLDSELRSVGAANSTEIMTVLNNNDLVLVATPQPGDIAESLGGVYDNTSGQRGVFSRLPFYRGDSLETTEGFTNSRHNGHPYLGFVAFQSNDTFIGAGVMVMEDYDSTTALREFFYPAGARDVAGATIDSGGTVVEHTPGSWQFSDAQRAGTSGFYQTSRFSADDGIWGFAAGGTVNGDTPGNGLHQFSSNRYGIQNYNGSDTRYPQVYWGSTSYGNGYMYVFVRYAD